MSAILRALAFLRSGYLSYSSRPSVRLYTYKKVSTKRFAHVTDANCAKCL